MRKNIFSIFAAILSLISLIIGLIKLIPQFNKAGAPDKTWIIFIVTVCPLMTLIYAIAGTDEDAKSVAPNSFGLLCTIPAIIAAIYLNLWLIAIFMLFVAVFIIKQLFIDLNEQDKNH